MTHSESAVQTPVAAVQAVEAGVRFGAITLARHGEPALSRKCMITSDQYRDWWGRYEIGGLRAGQTPPQTLLTAAEGAGAIYASTRPRAQETARAVAPDREVLVDALFIEAPL
ncbi:MAG TPA: histidine phosphatase family protein, partial [Brevundimonas sp.]|nr:histidine phosphatase family protein [Brevundimonas sp.]